MADDFSKLKEMKYSGRGITIGMTSEGNPFVGYTLTGRSPSSQARKLVYDKSLSTIRTDVTDQEQLSTVTWPVLGIFGAEDTSIAVETVNEFDAALGTLNIVHEVYIYPGVGHAFANPSGQNYAPDETKDAWGKTLAFLEKYLK